MSDKEKKKENTTMSSLDRKLEKEYILVHAGLGEYPGKNNMETYPE